MAGLGTCATRAVVALRSELERWTWVSDVVAQTPTSAASTLVSTLRGSSSRLLALTLPPKTSPS